MLDLLTLGFSTGLQSELETARKQTGNVATHQPEEASSSSSSVMAQAAESLGNAMESVENAVCSVFTSGKKVASSEDQQVAKKLLQNA